MAESIAGLGGVLVTYERPGVALAYLHALREQHRVPAALVIVDNSSVRSAELAQSANRLRSMQTQYVHSGINLGPAAGFNLGMSLLRRWDCSWAVLLDDDDPPSDPRAIGVLFDAFMHHRARCDRVAGVGYRGAVLRSHAGRAKAVPAEGSADHLHGGYLPLYDLAALRDVADFDPYLFWGFEELDLGRRLLRAGYSLIGLNDLANTMCANPKATERAGRIKDLLRPRPCFARYITSRNLIKILRSESPWFGVPLVALRMLLRAAVTDFVTGNSAAMTASTWRGIVDGLELRRSFVASFEAVLEDRSRA